MIFNQAKKKLPIILMFGFILGTSFAGSQFAYATPQVHGVVFTETSPVAGSTYMGSFTVDDSLLVPNSCIPVTSFTTGSVTVGTLTYDLTISLDFEGCASTDGLGVITVFDNGDSDADFGDTPLTCLLEAKNDGTWTTRNFFGTCDAIRAGTYEISSQQLVGGEILPINSMALMLAGVQSISMWMIPVVLAGAGIGVFVIKRRNL